MALDNNIIADKLSSKFGDKVSDFRVEDEMLVWNAEPVIIKELLLFMRDDETLRFNFLTDLCGVHYPDNAKEKQFTVVYLLHNWVDNTRVRVKVSLDGAKPEVDTVTEVFKAANWMERETFDFFGIIFKGHPNLKKILNDEAMTSFPLRKEFPLEDSQRTDKDDRFFGRTTNNDQLNAK